MVSGYDVIVKLYQHHVIERHTHTVDAINVLYIFCSWYTVILAVKPNIVQLLYHVSSLLTRRL